MYFIRIWRSGPCILILKFVFECGVPDSGVSVYAVFLKILQKYTTDSSRQRALFPQILWSDFGSNWTKTSDILVGFSGKIDLIVGQIL